MSITKRTPNGSYYFRKTIHGREIYQSLHTKRLDLARARAKGIEEKARAGQFDAVAAVRTRNGSPTAEKVVEVYQQVAAARGLKTATINANVAKFRAVVGVEGEWKHVRLHELDRRTIKAYVDSKQPKSPTPQQLARWKRTIKSTLTQARSLFAAWVMEHYQDRGLNIPDLSEFLRAEGVSAKGAAKRYIRPSPEMERRILEGAARLEDKRPDLYTVFLLVHPIALRADEAANARAEWLTRLDSEWTFRVPVDDAYSPKGARDRLIPVHPDVAEDLREASLRSGTGYFLPGAHPTARYDLVGREFASWMRGLGWDRLKCAHELRALQGCRWYTEQGAEIAQLLLGHRSMQTTCQFYANYTRRPEPLAPNWKA